VNEEEASLFDMLWLLLASVIFVPIFQKIPGGILIPIYLSLALNFNLYYEYNEVAVLDAFRNGIRLGA
jgi:hypothetical protein